MALSGIFLILSRAVSTILFQLLRVIVTSFQQLKWKFDGTAELLVNSHHPDNYEQSAHVLNIIMRHKFDILNVFSTTDFICTHNRFVSPSYVLSNDNVSLLTITETDAVFIEACESNMLLWRSEYSPFLKNAQMQYGHKLIVVPLNAFQRMSEKLGDRNVKLIMLFNCGRCGGTLLTQVFENAGLVAVSEPDALNKLAVRFRTHGDSEELRILTRNVVKWLCRPYKDIEPNAYVLKVSSVSTFAMRFFSDVFPRSSFLYMYRDTLKVAESCYRVAQFLPSLNMMYILGKYSSTYSKMCYEAMGFAGEEFHIKFVDDLSFGVLIAVQCANAYLDLYRNQFKIAAIRYEDFIASPLAVQQRIFTFCDLPLPLTDSLQKVMDQDSQKNTPVAQNLQRQQVNPNLSQESKFWANRLLLKHGLPIIGQECLLDGTISNL
jgi:Sulfotransferase domain